MKEVYSVSIVVIMLALFGGLDSKHARSATVSFAWLAPFPGDRSSFGLGVSADGSTVVGRSLQNGADPLAAQHAFEWTKTGGMVAINDLPGGNNVAIASAASANGSVIVGASSSARSFAGGSFYKEPFRWTAAGGTQALGFLSNYPASYADASDVSADGSVIVGTSVDANGEERPFRWTQSGGMVSLGTLTNYSASNQNSATAVSADGSIVVGTSTASASGQYAFEWTQSNGMKALGGLPGAGTLSNFANGISADGSTIVGSQMESSGNEAFAWTSAHGMVGLGDLPGGGFNSSAEDASANGSIIVGSATSAAGTEAVIWDQTFGIERVSDLLSANGITLPANYRLTTALAVSDDGQTLVGWGTNAGVQEAWVATVPEPSALVLAAFAGLVLIMFRRLRRY